MNVALQLLGYFFSKTPLKNDFILLIICCARFSVCSIFSSAVAFARVWVFSRRRWATTLLMVSATSGRLLSRVLMWSLVISCAMTSVPANDGGGARLAGQQRHLAEKFARLDLADPDPVAIGVVANEPFVYH